MGGGERFILIISYRGMLQVNLWVVSAELSKAPCVKLGELTCDGMGSLVLSRKEPTCQCRRHRFNPWVGKIPWRRKWHPTPVFLPGEPQGQQSLVGCRLWGHTESDTTEAT